eukprot:750736-Hanusia_phi.AAC.1
MVDARKMRGVMHSWGEAGRWRKWTRTMEGCMRTRRERAILAWGLRVWRSRLTLAIRKEFHSQAYRRRLLRRVMSSLRQQVLQQVMSNSTEQLESSKKCQGQVQQSLEEMEFVKAENNLLKEKVKSQSTLCQSLEKNVMSLRSQVMQLNLKTMSMKEKLVAMGREVTRARRHFSNSMNRLVDESFDTVDATLELVKLQSVQNKTLGEQHASLILSFESQSEIVKEIWMKLAREKSRNFDSLVTGNEVMDLSASDTAEDRMNVVKNVQNMIDRIIEEYQSLESKHEHLQKMIQRKDEVCMSLQEHIQDLKNQIQFIESERQTFARQEEMRSRSENEEEMKRFVLEGQVEDLGKQLKSTKVENEELKKQIAEMKCRQQSHERNSDEVTEIVKSKLQHTHELEKQRLVHAQQATLSQKDKVIMALREKLLIAERSLKSRPTDTEADARRHDEDILPRETLAGRGAGEEMAPVATEDQVHIGLEISDSRTTPGNAFVLQVIDLMDEHGRLQGSDGYGNEEVKVHDELLEVDDLQVGNLSARQVRATLCGEANSLVKLRLRRPASGREFSVLVKRHASGALLRCSSRDPSSIELRAMAAELEGEREKCRRTQEELKELKAEYKSASSSYQQLLQTIERRFNVSPLLLLEDPASSSSSSSSSSRDSRSLVVRKMEEVKQTLSSLPQSLDLVNLSWTKSELGACQERLSAILCEYKKYKQEAQATTSTLTSKLAQSEREREEARGSLQSAWRSLEGWERQHAELEQKHLECLRERKKASEEVESLRREAQRLEEEVERWRRKHFSLTEDKAERLEQVERLKAQRDEAQRSLRFSYAKIEKAQEFVMRERTRQLLMSVFEDREDGSAFSSQQLEVAARACGALGKEQGGRGGEVRSPGAARAAPAGARGMRAVEERDLCGLARHVPASRCSEAALLPPRVRASRAPPLR